MCNSPNLGLVLEASSYPLLLGVHHCGISTVFGKGALPGVIAHLSERISQIDSSAIGIRELHTS